MFFISYTFYSYSCINSCFPAKENCPGDVPMKDGKCPEFECNGPSSCNNNGNCNFDDTACDCSAGFIGPDCSVNLEGEKSYINLKG